MKEKRTLSLLLSLALAACLAAPALAADGARAPEPWYAEAQSYVTEKGIMTGTPNGFEPDKTVTRSEVYQALWGLDGRGVVNYAMDYADVPGDAWYAEAARWATSEGLTNGVGGGLFAGMRDVTRAELACAFARYARREGWDVGEERTAPAASAPDWEQVPDWAREDVAFCYGLGLMTGDQDGALLPTAAATRAELATLLMRLDRAVPDYGHADVTIPVAGTDGIPAHEVPGTLTYPGATEGKKYPAVVMLHGTGSNRDEAGEGYAMAAPVMAQADIVTLRIDFMGSGGSAASYTDYCYTSADLDAKAAADYLAGLAYVDPDKIAVMGWSQGGTNALLAAAAYPETFRAVITWSGALDLTGMFEDFDAAHAAAQADGKYEMTFDWRDPLPVGERWFREVRETDVLAETAKIAAPVLAVNGDKDDVVPMDSAEKIAQAAQDGRTYTVEGADHTYDVFSGDRSALSEAVDVGIGFLQEQFNGAVTGTVDAVSKYGKIGTDISAHVFAGAGYEVGDILKIAVGGQVIEAPFGTGYSDVDTGEVIILTDTAANTIAAAINMGDFAKTYAAAPGDQIAFSMGEKAGYLEEHEIRNIDELRTDYASDEVFANFRAVTVGDIAEQVSDLKTAVSE